MQIFLEREEKEIPGERKLQSKQNPLAWEFRIVQG